MKFTTLKSFMVNEVTVQNKAKPSPQLNIKNNFQISPLQGSLCRGEFNIDITDKDETTGFHVSATGTSLFEVDVQRSKTEIHIEAMQQMFPYMRSFIQTLTANMGIPSIIIQPIDYGNMQIVNINIPNKS